VRSRVDCSVTLSFPFFAEALHALTQLTLFEARRMVALRFTSAVALLYTVTIAQAVNFTIINGQIFTPGLAIVNAPQPNTPLGGGMVSISFFFAHSLAVPSSVLLTC